MKLSYRDKIVLIVFVFIMTLFVGYFAAIKPKYIEIKDSKEMLSLKEQEKDSVDSLINELPDLRKTNENRLMEINKLSLFFISPMNTSQIDKYIYSIAVKNNISIDTMQLTPINKSELSYYGTLNDEEENLLKVDVNCANAKITFSTSSYGSIKGFLDNIDDLETSVIVDSCNIVYDDEKNTYNVTISINFYSI